MFVSRPKKYFETKCPPLFRQWIWKALQRKWLLIRQYFTKGSSFENISDDEVEAVMNKLNHRPRKTLNFKTPYAVFFAELLQEAAWVLELHFGVESTVIIKQ